MKQALLTASSELELGFVEVWLESTSSRSRMDAGWQPMTVTKVDGETPFSCCFAVLASWLRCGWRHASRGVTSLPCS
jgi:hypothetical protein